MSNAFDKASLVMLPHAYEEGKLYSLKPTDRSGDFTFSRGTDTATRVNEQGYIEKEYANLLEQSNTFSDAYWINTSPPTLTSNQQGYDGTNDAWLLTKDIATNYQGVKAEGLSFGGVNTFSFYAKSGDTDFVMVELGNNGARWFDLRDGSSPTGFGTGILSYSSVDVGNGWYRCFITNKGATINAVRIYVMATSGTTTTAGSFYLQDVMLNPGLVAYPYLETTTAPVYGGLTDDMPRLDYSGGATCPSLLLEPSRSNLIDNSEYITSANNASISYNATESPEGLLNAPIFTATSGDLFVRSSAFAISTGTSYSISFYIKAFGTAVGKVSTTSVNDTASDSFTLTDSWQRITYTGTATNTRTNAQLRIDAPNVGGVTGEQVAIYGLQVEAGSYPTSYIPTYGSSQTRAAEGQTYTGFSSLIGQTEGTLFLEIEGHSPNGTEIFSLNRTTTNAIFLDANNDVYRVFIWADGVTSTTFTSIANTDRIKIAVAYQSNNFAIYANGLQVLTNNTLIWTPDILIDTLNFNVGGYVNAKNSSKFNQLVLFKERLSNADLATLTAL